MTRHSRSGSRRSRIGSRHSRRTHGPRHGDRSDQVQEIERDLGIAFDVLPITHDHNDLPACLGKAFAEDEAFLTMLTHCASSERTIFSPDRSQVFPKSKIAPGMPSQPLSHLGDEPQYLPKGWVKFGLALDDRILSSVASWPVAYHGTVKEAIGSILLKGLRTPSRKSDVRHGQAYSTSKQSIYLSPSVEYAGFPCYAQFFKLAENRWAQVVAEVRVMPNSYSKVFATLDETHWPYHLPMDIDYPNTRQDLEWMVNRDEHVVVTGMMVREVGSSVYPDIYGLTATEVRKDKFSKAVGDEWRELRKREFKTYEHLPSLIPVGKQGKNAVAREMRAFPEARRRCNSHPHEML